MENLIINNALDKIQETTGIECEILSNELRIKDKLIDAQIEIRYNNSKKKYYVEAKQKLVPADVPKIIYQTKSAKPFIYLAEYITPKAMELLQFNNIAYADTIGNIYLKNKDLYIFIQTERTNRKKLKTHTKAFNKAGLKVVFQFLQNPEYLNKPYRFIGEKAKVTISTVGNVFKDLLKEKYIIRIDKHNYQFDKRDELFEEWIKAFNKNLRPKLKTKKYRWLNTKTNWKKIKLPPKTHWGGPNAAEIMTNHLIADKMQLYTALAFPELMKALKIIPDENGEIVVTEKFWKNENDDKDNMVDPILVYADLLHDTNPRYITTANKIYKDYVQDKL